MSKSKILADGAAGTPDPAPAKTGGQACPMCKAALAPGARICVSCGYDLRSGAFLKGAGMDAPPRVDASSSLQDPWDSATGRSSGWGSVDGSPAQTAEEPKRDFWQDAVRAFKYPFDGTDNAVTFGVLLAFSCLQVPLGYAAGLLGFLGILFIEGWLAAVYLSVVQDTAGGSHDLPGIKMEDGIIEDILRPLLKYIGASACALLPAVIFTGAIAAGVVSNDPTAQAILVILTVVGVFFWPMFIILFALDAPDMLLRVDLILASILRTFPQYMALLTILLLVGVSSIVPFALALLGRAGVIEPVVTLPGFGLPGALAQSILNPYLTIVGMRMIGLYYRHFRKRLAIRMD